jgi:hypothetical protein
MIFTKAFNALLFLVVMYCGRTAAQLCSICEDGSAPRNEDIVIRFFPGSLPQTRYTCGELFYLGKFPGALNERQCHALHTIVYRPCGCDAFETKMKEVLEFDVSNISGGSSVIVDSNQANSTATMYSRRDPLVNRSHFDPKSWRSVTPVPSPNMAPIVEEDLSTGKRTIDEQTKEKLGNLRSM